MHDLYSVDHGVLMPVSADEISQRAYAKWLTRIGSGRTCQSDWLEAEAELNENAVANRLVSELEDRLRKLRSSVAIAERRLAAEREIARLLAVATTFDEIRPQLLRIICGRLEFSMGILWIVDPKAEVLRCAEILDLKTAHSTQVAALKSITYPKGAGTAGRAWESGLPAARNHSEHDGLFARDAEAPVPADMLSNFAFPLQSGTRFLGVMEFYALRNGNLDGETVAMMTSIGVQITQFVERCDAEVVLGLEQHERKKAGRIQQGLLPRSQPDLPGYEVCGRCESAFDVGGDCFDFLPLPQNGEDSMGVLIADASGHHVGAALLAAETRAYLRALSKTTVDVAYMLHLLSEHFSENSEREGFVTALLLRLAPRSGAIDYVNAGHCPGLVFDRHGRLRSKLSSTRTPLGIDRNHDCLAQSRGPIKPGELILLFSDGLVEAWSPHEEMFGLDRLLDVIHHTWGDSPEQMLSSLFDSVRQFTNGDPLFDDMTAVAIKRD